MRQMQQTWRGESIDSRVVATLTQKLRRSRATRKPFSNLSTSLFKTLPLHAYNALFIYAFFILSFTSSSNLFRTPSGFFLGAGRLRDSQFPPF